MILIQLHGPGFPNCNIGHREQDSNVFRDLTWPTFDRDHGWTLTRASPVKPDNKI